MYIQELTLHREIRSQFPKEPEVQAYIGAIRAQRGLRQRALHQHQKFKVKLDILVDRFVMLLEHPNMVNE